jgi:hypothetical protein
MCGNVWSSAYVGYVYVCVCVSVKFIRVSYFMKYEKNVLRKHQAFDKKCDKLSFLLNVLSIKQQNNTL